MIKTLIRNEKGQGQVEYGLVLVLLAVGAIVAMRAFGVSVNTLFGDINTSIHSE